MLKHFALVFVLCVGTVSGSALHCGLLSIRAKNVVGFLLLGVAVLALCDFAPRL